jgi:dihydrofolate reductase
VAEPAEVGYVAHVEVGRTQRHTVEDDIEAVIRGLKAQPVGEIEVAGPDLAGNLTNLGLIDEYRLYLHPIVLGRGKPFFSGPRPPLRLVTSDLVGEDAIRLTYVPA